MTAGERKRATAAAKEIKRLAVVDTWTTKHYIAGNYSDKAFHGSKEWRHFVSNLIHGRRECEMCGDRNRSALRVVHLVPRFLAPERAFDKSNAVVKCGSCSADKTSNPPRKPGVILRRANNSVDTSLDAPDNK